MTNTLAEIPEILPNSGESSCLESVPFQLQPLPLAGRIRKIVTEIVCFVGMAVARVVRPARSGNRPTDPRKVLIIRRGGLGDVLMATPLLRGLREEFPLAKIYVLVSKQAVSGLETCSWVDQILEVPDSAKEWLRLMRKVRKEGIDTAIVLHRFYAPSLMTWLLGIPQRLGFDWRNHGFSLTSSIPFSAARSQTLQIGELLTLFGKPAAEPIMELPVSDESIRCAREVLRGWGVDPTRPLVGIHPGGGQTPLSSDPAKRWAPQRFGKLAELLMRRDGVQVVLLQGPGDEPFVEEVLRHMPSRPLGCAAGLPLQVFAALLRECNLVVANDTGLMHLAAAQGVSVVAIIGPTHPAYTPPRGSGHKVIWAGVPCSPCYHPEELIYGRRRDGKKLFECWKSTHECMIAITAEKVYRAVVQQIRLNAPRHPPHASLDPDLSASSAYGLSEVCLSAPPSPPDLRILPH